ncbi:MAG: tRNA preQ1(34) S-adenosylmethionine ribosyltransferase-isomerase QueA [Opitutaceae bacterium]
MPLAASLFDYDLPPARVAQTPAARRDASRLLVVHRTARRLEHRSFADLPEYLAPGDILFRNNAAVLPARLSARRPTGGAVECFLLRPEGDDFTWRCLVKPGRKLPPGATFDHPSGELRGEIVSREEDGSAAVRFTTKGGEPVSAAANRLGDVPLPPYITREGGADAAATRDLDRERYQTVYAAREKQVAVAAPTAGLHFTPELLRRLEATGVRTADLTLHVGLGTFRPISAENVEAHQIHREAYEIPAATRRLVHDPAGGRRIAVGTTSVRTLEDYLSRGPAAADTPFTAEASIYIHPPRRFAGVDALITNFHQPRSTLLCLVSAFLAPGSTDGIAWLHEIYREAIAREYRFLSYGDAMLIL